MNPTELRIYRTCDFNAVFVMQDDAGAAFDLTGWTVEAMMRDARNGELILDLAPTVTDAAAGEITIAISAEDTAELAVKSGVWDMILITPESLRLPPTISDKCSITNPVTRPD